MAAALVRKGDNREPDALFAHCLDRLTNYGGANGTGKLPKTLKGRRTAIEEAAYGSARVQVSAIMKEAGVTVPEARGGNTSNSRKPRAGAGNAKAKGKAKSAANDTKPVTIKAKTGEEFVRYALIQAKALQASLNRSAKAGVPSDLGTAINAFVTAAIAAEKAL
jgi:hypothetical protein